MQMHARNFKSAELPEPQIDIVRRQLCGHWPGLRDGEASDSCADAKGSQVARSSRPAAMARAVRRLLMDPRRIPGPACPSPRDRARNVFFVRIKRQLASNRGRIKCVYVIGPKKGKMRDRG